MVTRIEEGMQVLKDHIRFTVDRSSIDGNSNSKKTLVDKVDPSAPPVLLQSHTYTLVNIIELMRRKKGVKPLSDKDFTLFTFPLGILLRIVWLTWL